MGKIVSLIITLSLAFTTIKSLKFDEELREQFIRSTCNFTVELLKMAAKEDENTILSTSSVSMLLALIQQGAEGNTAVELEDVLGSDAELNKIGYKNLTGTITKNLSSVTLDWGNKVYIKPGLTLHSEFKYETEKNFEAQFEEIDFANSPYITAGIINEWIREVTRDKIKDVVEPDMVSAGTIMLLVNVMYFKGMWLYRFREKNTRMDNFERNMYETVPTPFMYQRNKFYTGRNLSLGVKWIEMPFEGGSHKMLFVLPLKRHGISKVMKRITGEDLYNMINFADLTDVRVRLPKFNVRNKYYLNSLLETLGLRDLFTEGSSLGRISPEPVQISDIVHESNLEIDEKGSTGSAATVATISRKLILTETFRFDHPFLFFLVDTDTQIPLFAGKLVDPTAS